VKLIRKLASIRTPNPNSGFSIPTNFTTSQAPAVLQPHAVYHSKKDPLTKEPLKERPKIYEVSEEIINSNWLMEE
jgi:hypothetical protein